MAVFDARQGQVLSRPVSNYYEGKAMRLGIAQGEKELEQADKKLDLEERRVEVSEGQLRAAREQFESDVGRERAQGYAQDLYAIIYAVDQAVTAGEMDETEALETAAIGFTKYADTLPEEYAAPVVEKLKDGLTIEEYRQIKASNAGALNDYGLLDEDATSDYTLGKGRYSGTTNELIAGVAPTEGTEDSSVRGQKIADAARMLNGDFETATKIVDGHIEMRQNEKTGMIELMDKVTGEAWEVPLTYDEVPTAAPEPGRTLWDLSGHATGPISAIKAVGNIPAAWVGLRTASKVTQARQTFRTTGQNFIRALSINPRFPVGEQDRIREEIALVPAVFDSPSLMRDRMISLSGDLNLRMDQALSDSKNTRLPEDTRKSQASNANEIKNFLAVMGVPDSTVEVPDFVTGEDRDLWGAYSEEDRKKLYPQYGE